MSSCLECGRGIHFECEYEECPTCSICNPDTELQETIIEINDKESHYDTSKEYKDPASTGRHRAALLYPYICDSCGHTKSEHSDNGCSKGLCDCSLYKWKACQWRGTKNNGGGRNPIIGCGDGIGSDRHHGPCKDPLRNELGNVSLICSPCHQRWHMLNDEYYDEKEFMQTKHEPSPATDKEILDNELKWADGWYNRHFKLKQIRKLDKND